MNIRPLFRQQSWETLSSELDRLNHVLIPKTKEERDRFRNSRFARAFRWMVRAYERFTDDGQLLLTITLISGVIAMDVKRSHVYLAWAILFGLLASSWAASFFFKLKGVRAEVLVPRRVTVGEPMTFTLRLHNPGVPGARDHQAIRVRGPFLPWDGAWIERRTGLSELPVGRTREVELRARFRERGEHHLDSFRLQALVPLGIAVGPALLTSGPRFLVVPKVARVTSLVLQQGRRHQPGGVPRALRTADSRELLGVRPYRFGDPVRDLHARTWARVGEPIVREYREEYFSRVGLVLDTDLDRDPTLHLEAAISLVAGIVARLGETEALVDVIVLGQAVHSLTLGRSLATLDAALDLLACVEEGPKFDAERLLSRLGPHLSRLSSVVVVALRWDSAREALAKEIESRGVTCKRIAVGREMGGSASVREVSADAIQQGAGVPL